MRTKIFLELCCNHNGSITKAKKMILEASRLDVFGIKLQKRDLNSIPHHLRNQMSAVKIFKGLTAIGR